LYSLHLCCSLINVSLNTGACWSARLLSREIVSSYSSLQTNISYTTSDITQCTWKHKRSEMTEWSWNLWLESGWAFVQCSWILRCIFDNGSCSVKELPMSDSNRLHSAQFWPWHPTFTWAANSYCNKLPYQKNSYNK